LAPASASAGSDTLAGTLKVARDLKGAMATGCGYRGGAAPGYEGFGASFKPNGWEIDAGTLYGIEDALSGRIRETDTRTKAAKAVVCVDALRKGSNETTSKKTYISTFTLRLVFFARDLTSSTHVLKFTIGSPSGRTYTLDGHRIQ